LSQFAGGVVLERKGGGVVTSGGLGGEDKS